LFRKNEIKSLEERQQKDNQARIMDIAKLDGKLDSENAARKATTSNSTVFFFFICNGSKKTFFKIPQDFCPFNLSNYKYLFGP
jgi:hypothetical protein